MYYALIYITLMAAGGMSFMEDYIRRWNVLVYLFLGSALVLLATFRPAEMDNDYNAYVEYFTRYDDESVSIHVEWSFIKIAEIINLFTHDHVFIFFVYALIGVAVKFIALQKLSDLYFLPICIYIGYYYVLHDFTQIRAGVSSAFMLLGISYFAESKWKTTLCYAVAILFHYSAISLLPTLMLTNKKFSLFEKILWPILFLLSYGVYFLHISISSLPIPYIQEKLELYDALTTVGFIDEANVFNMLLLLRIVCFLYFLYYFDVPCKYVKAFPIAMRFWGISICAFITLTSLPVLSFRISELFALVDIVLFPSLIYTINPKWLPKTALVLFGAFLLFMQAYISKILVVM